MSKFFYSANGFYQQKTVENFTNQQNEEISVNNQCKRTVGILKNLTISYNDKSNRTPDQLSEASKELNKDVTKMKNKEIQAAIDGSDSGFLFNGVGSGGSKIHWSEDIKDNLELKKDHHRNFVGLPTNSNEYPTISYFLDLIKDKIHEKIGAIVMITNDDNKVVECKAKGTDWNLAKGNDHQHLFIPKESAKKFKCNGKECNESGEDSTFNNWNKHVEDGQFTLNIVTKMDQIEQQLCKNYENNNTDDNNNLLNKKQKLKARLKNSHNLNYFKYEPGCQYDYEECGKNCLKTITSSSASDTNKCDLAPVPCSGGQCPQDCIEKQDECKVYNIKGEDVCASQVKVITSPHDGGVQCKLEADNIEANKGTILEGYEYKICNDGDGKCPVDCVGSLASCKDKVDGEIVSYTESIKKKNGGVQCIINRYDDGVIFDESVTKDNVYVRNYQKFECKDKKAIIFNDCLGDNQGTDAECPVDCVGYLESCKGKDYVKYKITKPRKNGGKKCIIRRNDEGVNFDLIPVGDYSFAEEEQFECQNNEAIISKKPIDCEGEFSPITYGKEFPFRKFKITQRSYRGGKECNYIDDEEVEFKTYEDLKDYLHKNKDLEPLDKAKVLNSLYKVEETKNIIKDLHESDLLSLITHDVLSNLFSDNRYRIANDLADIRNNKYCGYPGANCKDIIDIFKYFEGDNGYCAEYNRVQDNLAYRSNSSKYHDANRCVWNPNISLDESGNELDPIYADHTNSCIKEFKLDKIYWTEDRICKPLYKLPKDEMCGIASQGRAKYSVCPEAIENYYNDPRNNGNDLVINGKVINDEVCPIETTEFDCSYNVNPNLCKRIVRHKIIDNSNNPYHIYCKSKETKEETIVGDCQGKGKCPNWCKKGKLSHDGIYCYPDSTVSKNTYHYCPERCKKCGGQGCNKSDRKGNKKGNNKWAKENCCTDSRSNDTYDNVCTDFEDTKCMVPAAKVKVNVIEKFTNQDDKNNKFFYIILLCALFIIILTTKNKN